jgi:hypothetical protein
MDNLLGEIDGFFSAGELTYLWERGLVEGRKCGCGALLRDCALWSTVLKVAFGEPYTDEVDPRRVVSWQHDAVRVRHAWRLLRHHPGISTGSPALDSYVEVLGRLYPAISEVTGARVIVDSSKRPSDAAVLRLVRGVDPYFVHLVRDPRAVAYSWRRRKAQPDRDRPAELVPHGPADSTTSWVGWNLAAEALTRRNGPGRSTLLRYEDFVANPRRTLVELAALVGERPHDLPLDGERTAKLGGNHTSSGNPSRFKTGTIELREDTEWLTQQARADRVVATTLALPLLRRYGYPLRPKAPGSLPARANERARAGATKR